MIGAIVTRSCKALAVLGLATGMTLTALAGAEAAGEAPTPPSRDWSFDGIFGTFDRASAQRGFQVYRTVCAGCHALDYVAFRNLADLGYNEAEIKQIASEYTIVDGPNDEGEMFERPGLPADRFPAPFPNEQAARFANGGAYPPDLSLIIKARPNGANYVHALLTGYSEPPADVTLGIGQYWNEYFPGHQLAMAQPLYGEDVEYADGTPATIEQEAHDVVTFLTWASEPTMEARKTAGVMTILFLIVFTGLLYATKRKIWADLH